MSTLILPKDLEALQITWKQFVDALNHHDRSVAITYAKQHIAHIYGTIKDLEEHKT